MSGAKLMAEKTSFWQKLKKVPIATSGQRLAGRNRQQS